MKTPYDKLAKIYTKCTGHMTKMATTPIYGKNPLNAVFNLGLQQRGPTGPIQPKIGGHLEKEGALT